MTVKRKRAPVALVALIGLALAVPAHPAAASLRRREAQATRCPTSKSLVRIDTKICPATRRRAAILLRRGCCRAANGKVKCKAFGSCPNRSPS